MKARTMAGSIAAATVMTFTGFGYAAAQPGDFSTLPVDPNLITDSLAYNAAPLVLNPNGQPGVQAVYTHRDGSRQITSTILVLPDAPAADAALDGARMVSKVANSRTAQAAVGSKGTIVSGTSPDGSKSVSVLSFVEGNAATTIEFDGAPKDPAPPDLVLELGRKQDTAIRDWQAA
jgi:hypothetical protein